MYGICNFLRGISSCSPICETSDNRCVANENVQGIAFFCRFFAAVRWVAAASGVGYQEVNLRIKLYFSWLDQFVIFNYLIGAKDVEIRPFDLA